MGLICSDSLSSSISGNCLIYCAVMCPSANTSNYLSKPVVMMMMMMMHVIKVRSHGLEMSQSKMNHQVFLKYK